MKVQLKPGEAVKFGGRRVASTEDELATLVGDEAALLPLVKQGLATEVVDAPARPVLPPPPAAAPLPEAQPEAEPENTDASPLAAAPAEPLTTATAPTAPAAAKTKKRA